MKQITLVQVGIGTVGGEVVAQVLANREHWRRRFDLDVTIGAVVGRAGALVAEDLARLDEDALVAVVAGRRSGTGLADIAGGALVPPAEAVARIGAERPTIVLDAAAGDETAALDARALASGAGVVLSNKAPLALPAANPLSGELWAAAAPGGHLRFEATCGAGLPVISTLRALLDTGDEVVEIQGLLSGTLGAIFTDVGAGRLFSAAVRDARQHGFTEPDPRDDLSGLDVARKALILARTIGRAVDLSEVAVENLVPESLRGCSAAEFLERVDEVDAAIARRAATAAAGDRTLRYVAVVTPDQPIAVGLREVARAGLVGTTHGPENVIAIRTARYAAHPLTVVGPGAGAAVTAAGMLADMLALAGAA